MQLAVGGDAHDAVEPFAAGRVIALADADASHLGSVALARLLLFFFPLEHLGALAEGFLHEGARYRALVGAHLARRFRRIDAADSEPIDAELARRLVDHRLDELCELIFSGIVLRLEWGV